MQFITPLQKDVAALTTRSQVRKQPTLIGEQVGPAERTRAATTAPLPLFCHYARCALPV